MNHSTNPGKIQIEYEVVISCRPCYNTGQKKLHPHFVRKLWAQAPERTFTHMKNRLLPLLLISALLAASLPALGEAVPEAVTARSWRSEYGTVVTFSPNGAGVITDPDGKTYELTWTYQNGVLEYYYSVKVEMFGGQFDYKLSKTLLYSEENGIPSLSGEGDRKGTAVAYLLPVDVYDQVKAGFDAALSPYAATLGEEIDLGFVRFTVKEVRSLLEVTSKAGGTGMAAVAGKRYICLVGSIENTGANEINLENIAGRLTLDGDRVFTITAGRAETANGMMEKLGPSDKGTLYVHVQVPEKDASSFSSLSFVMALNEGLGSCPAFAGAADFAFEYVLSGEQAQAAGKLPEKEVTWFKESPALIRPDSFVDVRQSATSTSSSNGKTTRISYTFTPQTAAGALEMLNTYAEKLKEYGYTVQQSGGTLKITYQKKALATVTVEDGKLKFDVIPGNENLKRPEKQEQKKRFSFGK